MFPASPGVGGGVSLELAIELQTSEGRRGPKASRVSGSDS